MADADSPFSDLEDALKSPPPPCAGPTSRSCSAAAWRAGRVAARRRARPRPRWSGPRTSSAARALRAAGMRSEDPPEEWLVKAWDGDALVDLIHHPKGMAGRRRADRARRGNVRARHGDARDGARGRAGDQAHGTGVSIRCVMSPCWRFRERSARARSTGTTFVRGPRLGLRASVLRDAGRPRDPARGEADDRRP